MGKARGRMDSSWSHYPTLPLDPHLLALARLRRAQRAAHRQPRSNIGIHIGVLLSKDLERFVDSRRGCCCTCPFEDGLPTRKLRRSQEVQSVANDGSLVEIDWAVRGPSRRWSSRAHGATASCSARPGSKTVSEWSRSATAAHYFGCLSVRVSRPLLVVNPEGPCKCASQELAWRPSRASSCPR
eukprot:366496-Chlamydomonas_euryale.AAC.14